MRSIYESRQRLKFCFICTAILIAITSLVVSDWLIKDLAREERLRIEVWREVTQAMINENPDLSMGLFLKIIQSNTTIPVVLCNELDSALSYNNIEIPKNDSKGFLQSKIQELKKKNLSVVIDMKDGTYQYLYYDDSIILKRLLIYPYAQLLMVFVFLVIAFLALMSAKRAEQDKIWVGLSKETAHQLGTPISSLIAWIEYLRILHVEESLLSEMEKDVKSLETISDRFAKIDADPDLSPINLLDSIRTAIEYMETRISSKVKIYLYLPDKPIYVFMNDSLFAWVIENLIKNAVDAMEGQGKISLRVEDLDKKVWIDIIDTGKGLLKSKYKVIFHPGYTTKKRGWGLGLPLVKRIVESFQGGKIFVKDSGQGKGTIFRIELRKCKR